MENNKKTHEEVADMIGVPVKWINKYTIATTFFVVWMVFFDQHNVFASLRLQGMLQKLELEKKSYLADIDQSVKDKQDLVNDKEKFAREKHLMHKADEEIILIETKNEK